MSGLRGRWRAWRRRPDADVELLVWLVVIGAVFWMVLINAGFVVLLVRALR